MKTGALSWNSWILFNFESSLGKFFGNAFENLFGNVFENFYGILVLVICLEILFVFFSGITLIIRSGIGKFLWGIIWNSYKKSFSNASVNSFCSSYENFLNNFLVETSGVLLVIPSTSFWIFLQRSLWEFRHLLF